jgi:hypothetical protein
MEVKRVQEVIKEIDMAANTLEIKNLKKLKGPLNNNSAPKFDKDKIMPFTEEPTGYEKTILSDLQGAWILLREFVVDTEGFEGMDRVLFHIDEAMSWETVRNLRRMPPLLLIIRNICIQAKVPTEVIESIKVVDDILKEVLSEYHI